MKTNRAIRSKGAAPACALYCGATCCWRASRGWSARKNPLVPENRVDAKYSGRGGDLGHWIYPVVVADELKINPNAKAEEGWGWLPPPLIGEGKKVQTKWLHDFLLEPMAIRPAVRAADAEIQHELAGVEQAGRFLRRPR